MLKNLDENDVLAKMFLLFMALFHTVTGLYIVLTDNVKYESPTYLTMSSLISLNYWGIIFVIVGGFYFFAAFHEGKIKHQLMVVAGILGGIIFGLYAMASVEVTTNVMVAARYAIVGIFNAIISVIGGYSLWRLRK